MRYTLHYSTKLSIVVLSNTRNSRTQGRHATLQVTHGLLVIKLLLPGHPVLDPVAAAGASAQVLLGRP